MADPTPDSWRLVDAYLTNTLVGHDADLVAAVADQNAAGLPPIEVAPVNGKLLHLLTRMSGARRVLEVGTRMRGGRMYEATQSGFWTAARI